MNKYYDQLEAAGHVGVMIADHDKACRIRWKVQSDQQRASLGQTILTSCYRPFSEFPPPPTDAWILMVHVTELGQVNGTSTHVFYLGSYRRE